MILYKWIGLMYLCIFGADCYVGMYDGMLQVFLSDVIDYSDFV
jgi:hypothetical protein